jgi:hypothetical protein
LISTLVSVDLCLRRRPNITHGNIVCTRFWCSHWTVLWSILVRSISIWRGSVKSLLAWVGCHLMLLVVIGLMRWLRLLSLSRLSDLLLQRIFSLVLWCSSDCRIIRPVSLDLLLKVIILTPPRWINPRV